MALSERRPVRPPPWRPPTDLYETEHAVVVRVEIAGMRTEDFKISLERRTLSIQGIRPASVEPRAYHRLEIGFGEFSTEVVLPCAVLADAIQADYNTGFLRIELPKQQAHSIQVKER